MKRVDAPLGIVVAGLVLLVGSAAWKWLPGILLGTAAVLGAMAASWQKRR